MTVPFVSIVICSRNRLKSLRRYALPSIETIDYPSFEVVIVDDASADGTWEFLKDYQLPQARLKVVRNKKAKGLCNARNMGVANSSGEIIAFIDDDCAVSTTWINEIVKAYTRDSIAVVGGISYKGDSPEIYINDRHVWGCNMSFRASIFKRFQFDTGLKYSHYADETDLIGRIISHGYERVVAKKAIAKHFVEDAAYRKQVPLSSYLNYHYMNAKQSNWRDYYKYVASHSLKHVAIVEYGLNFKGQPRPWIQNFIMVCKKSIYYLYVLMLEIPIAAKIKHAQEERLFNSNRPLR